MARRPHHHHEAPSIPEASSPVGRARRHLRRGDLRKASVALREACLIHERDAALWTQYGAVLARIGHYDDAAQAFRHALWLRRAASDGPRARVTESLLQRLSSAHAALTRTRL